MQMLPRSFSWSPCLRVCTVVFLGFPSLREPRPGQATGQVLSPAEEVASVQRCDGDCSAKYLWLPLVFCCAAASDSFLTSPFSPHSPLPDCSCIEAVQKCMRQHDGSLVQVRVNGLAAYSGRDFYTAAASAKLSLESPSAVHSLSGLTNALRHLLLAGTLRREGLPSHLRLWPACA